MKVTVCELSDQEESFQEDWSMLINYLKQNETDLLLLPEMPFHEWIAANKNLMHTLKEQSVDLHEKWLLKLPELNVDSIVYSKPVIKGNRYHNTAFIWHRESGHHQLHTKQHFPEEEIFWEASLYSPDNNGFKAFELKGLKIGILLCSEMWFTEHARNYGKQGIDLLLCPRATGQQSTAQWTRCGQTLAVISGAYCLSSNKTGAGPQNFTWGGTGWIAQPLDGKLIGTTNIGSKFFTAEIDIETSKRAKLDYPLNVHQFGKK